MSMAVDTQIKWPIIYLEKKKIKQAMEQVFFGSLHKHLAV